MNSLESKYKKINEIQREAAIQKLSQSGFDEMMLRRNPKFLITLWNDFIVPNKKES